MTQKRRFYPPKFLKAAREAGKIEKERMQSDAKLFTVVNDQLVDKGKAN